MSPILFEAGTTQFDTLGLGVLSDVTSALVTEELNGEFTLTMEYKVGGKLSTEIKQNRILVVSSSPTAQRQAFMIRKITKPIKGKFTVYAEHVSYLSYDMTLRPIQSVTGDAGQALTTWKGMLTSTTAFTVWSDITTTNQTSFGMPEFENARQALGGHAGSILDVWGGEYEFDNYAIRLHKQRGHAANTIVAYGRNLTDFTQEESILDTWTSIYPYVTLMNDGESNESTTYYLDELVVDGEHVNDYPNRRAKPVDFSQEFKDASEFTQDKLRSLANSYMHNNNFGVPSVSITLSALDLAKAAGYDTVNGGDPETINLADTVNVYFDKIGVRTSAQVTRVVWNVLKESYDSYDLGAKKASLADSIKDQVNTAVDNSNKALTDTIQTIVSSDGRHNTSFGDSSQGMPLNPKEGDIYFMEDGDDSYLYVAEVGEDGTVSWVLKTSTKSGEYINSAVDSAVSEATSHADSLNTAQTSIANSISASAAAALASASTARSSIASQASSMANSAAAKGSSAANSAYTAAMSGAAVAVNALSSGVGVAITSTADSLNGKLATAITSANVTASSYATVARNEAIATASQNATTITSVAISNFGSQVASAYVQNTMFNQTANDIQMAATKLKTKVNSMGQINQLFNTEFYPDWQGWYDGVASATTYQTGTAPGNKWGLAAAKYSGSTVILKDVSSGANAIYSDLIPVGQNVPIVASIYTTSSNSNSSVTAAIYLRFYDSNKSYVGQAVVNSSSITSWQRIVNSTTTPTGTNYVSFVLMTNGNSGTNFYSEPMLVFANQVGDYVAGNYNNNARVSSLELDVDGITGVVNDPSKGLSATWNLANNGQTIAVQASNAAAQAITTASGIQTKVSAMGGVNQLPNTEWSPDLKGWYDGVSTEGTGVFTDGPDPSAGWALDGGKYGVSNVLRKQLSTGANSIHTGLVAVGPGVTVTASMFTYETSDSNSTVSGSIYLKFYDANKVYIGRVTKDSGKWTSWQRLALTTTTPANTAYVSFNILTNGNSGLTYYAQPMLEFSATVHDYVAGNYNNNSYLETIRTQLAGQITDETINRTTGDNSVRQQMTDLINQQVSSVTTGYKSSLLEASNALVAQISSLNLINNSQFEVVNGTMPGWHVDTPWGHTITVGSEASNNVGLGSRDSDGTVAVVHDYNLHSKAWIYSDPITTTPGSTYSGSFELAEASGWATSSQVSFARYVRYYDINYVLISSDIYNYFGGTIGGSWPRYSFTVKTPANTAYISFGIGWNGGTVAFRRISMYSGTIDYGYMPGSKSGNQTVLQLFQDNWAIGIKDNAGNLINGINGDTSGMTIAAKKLTVSADTTFLGNNWLNGAVIKDATIGRAQIAELSVDSSKIINLDVNKLSGNVANFIRTYWDGRYGSTSIDSEGMTVSAGLATTVFDKDGMKFDKSNRSIGRIGVNDLYQDSSKKGLYFGLESTGDFMAWGAQNYAGNPYSTKLSWFRSGAVPSNLPGLIEGFNFEDNVSFRNPIEIRGGIKMQGTNDNLLVRASNLNGGSYPTFGATSAYFVYAGSDIYLSSNGTAINLTKIIKAFGGIRTAAIPTSFNSNGTAAGWYNVNMG